MNKKVKTKVKTRVIKTKTNKSKTKPKIKPKIKYNQNDAEVRRIVNPSKNYYSINVPARFARELSYSKGDLILVRIIGVRLVIKKL